ncbi:hypothetical protein [Sphingomonas sp. CROZ-RG-20F-R02-07]|uniref:hypothetical protein n=1 Tax=Sphingomonas sp. CROZ-RG-20F-R02-07 TaxID=2914832 RepID=UPI001F59E7FD|nr:hypothetical protein [Sphingomonas sp. CROZ-RG-20F-R02-07]
MDFDTLLVRYFGQADLGALGAGAYEAGVDRLRVEFGLERDRGRRFALWSLMHLLGVAPALDVAFAHAADRDAARNFMAMAAAGTDDD